MKSEGLKYYLFGGLLLILFGLGLLVVRPVVWLEASQYDLTGSVVIGENEYVFEGSDSLVINNIRSIEGVAKSDNWIVYFDQNGADVSIDQLGYLYGNMVVGDNNVVSLDDKGVNIVNGVLSGSFNSDMGIVTFSGKTDWIPMELAEIQTSSVVKLDVNKKTKLDAKVLALGNRELYDVDIKWTSNDKFVEVDEYGYVLATEPGKYSNVIGIEVGGVKKAITLQAVQRIALSDEVDPPVQPNVVAQGSSTAITVFLEPKTAVSLNEDIVIDDVVLSRGNDEVSCNGITSRDVILGSIKTSCYFTDKGAGDWNLELIMSNNESYVFLAPLRVVNKENAINVNVSTKIMKEDPVDSGNYSECGAGVGENQTTLYDLCDRVVYDISIEKPSYLSSKDLNSGDLKIDFSINGAGPCKSKEVSLIGAYYDDDDKLLEKSLDIVDGDVKESIEMNYNTTFYQGCDLLAEVSLENLDFEGLSLNANTNTRVGIGYPKQVELSGDVIVEEGNIDIESTSKDAASYSLVAEDSIRISSQGQNQLSGYQISDQVDFAVMIQKVKDSISKMIIERGLDDISPTIIGNELNSFNASRKASFPEGRIIYDGYGVGDYLLRNTAGNVLDVCGPATLVIEGRDVYVEDNIRMKSATGECAQKGNFGLIVLDGDIIFDPAVTDVEGFYFTSGTIYTGKSDKSFTLTGVAVANNFVLERY